MSKASIRNQLLPSHVSRFTFPSMTHFGKIWQLSLISFIIAAITGFLYRAGLFYPVSDLFNLANIRHAHSHLMFFNWISPPIMAFMIDKIFKQRSNLSDSQLRAEVKSVHFCLYTMLFLGFLSYPFFLLYGYQSVSVGSAQLPLAAIISGFVMITWYWFIMIYIRNRKHCKSHLPILFFDSALLALVISSLGAWGVSVFQFTAADSALMSSALTHFFLSLFTEGWAILGILGILWSKAGSDLKINDTNWLWVPILLGAMLVFPFSLTQSLLSPLMIWTAKIGTLMIALSLILNVFFLSKTGLFRGFLWKSIGFFLLLKILFQIIAILPLDIWPGEHGVRVFYLHLILLGLVSVIIFTVYNQKVHNYPEILFTGSTWLVIISLAMISGYWPPQLQPDQIYYLVMILSVLPIFPALWIWIGSFSKQSGSSPY